MKRRPLTDCQQFSKLGQIYVVPTWTKGPQIVIPPSMGNWLGSRPDAILNAKDCTFETGMLTIVVVGVHLI